MAEHIHDIGFKLDYSFSKICHLKQTKQGSERAGIYIKRDSFIHVVEPVDVKQYSYIPLFP